MFSTLHPWDTVNAALQKGRIEEVSDEGQVRLRLPGGECEVVLIPLEQVTRVRALRGKGASL
jgi:hypothetical protein